MASAPITALDTAVSACAAVDLGGLSAGVLGSMVIDLRRTACRLEAEIARVVHAARQAESWRASGATSMESWLAAETKSSVRSAREQARLAAILAAAPAVASKMADGSLSVDNVHLLGAVVDHPGFAADADLLVGLASGSPRETRRGLEHWQATIDAGGEAEREETLRSKRHLRFTPNSSGMFDVSGVLMPDDVAHIRTAVEHIAGAAYDDETGRPQHMRIADALVELCQAYNAGTVTGGRERPKVMMVVPFETVVQRAATRGVIIGIDLTVSAATVRQMCCDAELNRVVTRGASTILDYGTTTRIASDAQYHALVARDGGCRWPGCDRPPGWTEVHHIDEVIRDDGPTNLANLALFCTTHHHLLHTPNWHLVGDTHNLTIIRPDGNAMPAPCRGPAFTQPRLVAS